MHYSGGGGGVDCNNALQWQHGVCDVNDVMKVWNNGVIILSFIYSGCLNTLGLFIYNILHAVFTYVRIFGSAKVSFYDYEIDVWLALILAYPCIYWIML